jgi:ABC-2 type transport system permease protein/capsular polysaccharide transport system permease protein
MVRDGYFGTKVEAIYDPGYLITCSLVLTVVALIATRWVEKRLTPQ